MKYKNKKILSYLISVGVIAVALIWVCNKFIHLGHVEYTDNAQIKRQIVPVNSRVQGYIKTIKFKEYEKVKRGDTLIIIDDTDLKLQVATAYANYEKALTNKNITEFSETASINDAAVTNASIKEAELLMNNAESDYNRYIKLLEKGAVTRQEYDRVKTAYEAKRAHYEMLVRQYTMKSTNVMMSKERVPQSISDINYFQALLNIAELNLSYTVITAPCDGYTSRKEIQEGQLVQPGQTLLNIISSEELWITANYKETQLQHIDSGSTVMIKVDAYPNSRFKGVVTSISTATGASLSLIPQDNSAGNFVKVRQRIPIRIDFTEDNDPADLEKLGAGMNVECEINY
ncbi:MAG: HlyD family secretion protein [Candidatus Aphodosoma sp.]